MIKCPACNATLPDGAVRCQFCGASLAVPQRSSPAPNREEGSTGTPPWVWPAYYGVAVWWILQGVVHVLLVRGGVVDTSINGLSAVIGLGLLARIELVRGITNVMCFLSIVGGLFGLGMAFLEGGWSGALGMLLAVVQIAMAGFMIFLIGETESRAPDL
ncbi:MAG: hypothetical protein ACP5VE_12530 [Chthonomonadales bacterium]